ncbi:TonB-dependent receptor [Algibacter amylolyticus]|uniref:TonB-dependent receptor n=1 Tax=Algibacter amylolyticus TaxID=1608400 RepID=A0A5M7BFP0_9FLAO|nr:TonB-dependent receptor [Algibacter amylolyticus]KAA5827690.1 TonB-dependent receptor [Algibacter amylolyticus]MBB5266906.1 iron complex outermembrane receptor protein [Algibacter amylolyticus]TSJ81935.1 TonB-dependent receptor [Algibacter amylolyticus]
MSKILHLKCLMFLFFIGLSGSAMAQEVSGTVKDDSGGLPGVSVIVKGTTTGTTTDFDGKYNVNAKTGDVLVFSYVGYETQEKSVSGTVINVTMQSGVALNEVVLIGSRNPSRTSVDTAVPVDVIDMADLVTAGPQVSVTQILNYVAPSFSSNTQTVADGTDHIDPAQLRGLGPDQVLVLVNGKRRHTSSLVNVNGTPGRGSVGTDLNAIPAASIKRIEVLRDGAAAQYGSDAIAGVINIVLKDNVNELTAAITTGANMSKNGNDHEGGTDGEKTQIDLNYGIPLGENGGFINMTGSLTTRERTSRARANSGAIFHAYNSIEWQANQAGFNLSDLRTDLDAIKDFAAQVDHFDAGLQGQIAGASSIEELSGYNTITGDQTAGILSGLDVTDAELAARGQTRSDYNMSVGQSALDQGQFMGNLEIPLGDAESEAKLYAFGGLSYRHGDASGFYRTPGHSSGRGNTLSYINGFLPDIESDIIDKSLGFGIQGKINDWNIDLSHTWGLNTFAYNITNTTNFYLQASSPTEFDAGLNGFQQNTVNFDMSKFYDDIMSGLNIAFGAEYRVENYFIEAGEESSYAKYDVNGEVETAAAAEDPTLQVTDFFGNQASAGAQVFSGFTPENAIDARRNSMALYVDVEADITEEFLMSGAVRFEDFSDFGSTLNGKLAMRYKLSDNTNIRGALSTGFRAPSLHQQFYSKSNTLFNDQGIAQEVGTFTNSSRAAKLVGIPKLKEETSFNASLGFTTKIPDANLTVTIDGYFIAIDDRITYTGNFGNPNDGTPLSDIFTNLGIGQAAFFANAIDTETNGLDVVVSHKANVGEGRLTNNLAATYSKTKKVGATKGSDLLTDAGLLDNYFDEGSRVYLELAVPRVKANLSHNLEMGDWSIFLRNAFFGSVFDTGNLTDGGHPEIGSNVVTDLTIGYNFSDELRLTVGANNLLDVYPDELPGYLTSSNQFVYSRRVSQFGNNGRYVFGRLTFVLK